MPIEKRKVGSKKNEDSIKKHEIYKDGNGSENDSYDNSNNPKGSSGSQLTGWVVVIGVVLVIFIIFTFSKFNTLTGGNRVQDLERKIGKLEGKIANLEKHNRLTVSVRYAGGSSTSNNVSWIGEKSLGFPEEAKGKICYIIGEKLRGEGGGSIGGYLGKNDNGSRYQYATMYEAEINNLLQKIEITKNGGNSNSNLTKYDRDNLYVSFTMLCH